MFRPTAARFYTSVLAFHNTAISSQTVTTCSRRTLAVATAAVAPPQPDGQPRKFSPKINAIVDQIASLTLVEVADLNCALKDRLNLPDTPAAGAGMVMMSPAGQAEAAVPAKDAIPEKVNFSVILQALEKKSKKIALIKAVKKCVPGLNLVQSKKFVESLPKTIKDDIPKDDAEKLKKVLVAAGGKVEIK